MKNLKTPKKVRNLKFISFFIKARKKTISSQLKLHKDTKVHHKTYILLLKLIDSKMFI